MLTYPHINPVAISIGPVAGIGPLRIHWYGIMYLIGFVAAWWLARYRARRPGSTWVALDIDDLIFYCAIGVIAGGRIGWCIFYGHDVIAQSWLNVFHIWDGGMSFHGGLLGMIVAFLLFCRKYHIRFFQLADVFACAAPIGLFLGRLANFINGELYGRPTDAPWGMIFPRAGDLPRHPSQLYEATMEGIILFIVMNLLLKYTSARDKPGLLSGVFISGYAVSRIIAECFREPDDFLGFFMNTVTMGQILSLPMLAYGIYLIVRKPRES